MFLLGQQVASAPVIDSLLRIHGPHLICLEGCMHASAIGEVICAKDVNGRKWNCNAASLPAEVVLKTQLLFCQVVSFEEDPATSV